MTLMGFMIMMGNLVVLVRVTFATAYSNGDLLNYGFRFTQTD